MRKYDMTAVYTIAAMPQSDRFSDRPVPLPVKMAYTLADATEIAKKYNENPIYKGILRNYRFSHFVPFNIEALTMAPPRYHLG